MSTNVAVSSQRIPQLLGQLKRSSDDNVFELIDCKLDSGHPSISDLCTARIRARVKKYSHIDLIEMELESSTRPSHDSKECEQKASELRHAKWELETIRHGLRVTQAAHDREKQLAVEIPDSQPTASIHLVGHRREEGTEGSKSLRDAESILVSLDRDLMTQERTIASLSSELDALQTRSKGFFSFSGAQRVYPVVPCISRDRAIVLALLSISIWILIAVLYRGVVGGTERRRSATQTTIVAKAKSRSFANRKSIDLGIPCLGSVSIEGLRPLPSKSLALDASFSSRSADSSTKMQSIRPKRFMLHWNLIPERAVTLWFVVLIVRFIFDGIWRELFTAAPLAAITCLIGGVP